LHPAASSPGQVTSLAGSPERYRRQLASHEESAGLRRRKWSRSPSGVGIKQKERRAGRGPCALAVGFMPMRQARGAGQIIPSDSDYFVIKTPRLINGERAVADAKR
jgi:hypothetical protein